MKTGLEESYKAKQIMNVTLKNLSGKILVLAILFNCGSVFSQAISSVDAQINETNNAENPMKPEQRPPAFDYTPEQWFNRIIELAENELPEPAVFEKEFGVVFKVSDSKEGKFHGGTLNLPLNQKLSSYYYKQQFMTYSILKSYNKIFVSLPASLDSCVLTNKFLNHVKKNNWEQVIEIDYFAIHGPRKSVFFTKNIFGKNGESKKHKFAFTMNNKYLHWFEIREETDLYEK